MSTIATREYYAHKDEYDQIYYAYPVEGKPEMVSLRRRTHHAGNSKGSRQVDRIGEISRGVKAIMENPIQREAFHRDWMDYYRRRKVSHRDPYIYKHEQKIYKVRTLREYVRTMYCIANQGNIGMLKTPAPTICE